MRINRDNDRDDSWEELKPHHYCIRCLSPSYCESDPDLCASCDKQLDEFLEEQKHQ